jgi:hypothetical protein
LTDGSAEGGAGLVPTELRVARLLRVEGYLDGAMLAMWALPERAELMLGMAEASVRGVDLDDPDAETFELLGRLVSEARGHNAGGRFAATMARLRVAGDLASLRAIRLSAGEDL